MMTSRDLLTKALAVMMALSAGTALAAPKEGHQASSGDEVVMTIVGDCTLGGYQGQQGPGLFREYFASRGGAYFTSQVRDLFATDDITYVNLEGPLTRHPQVLQKQFPIRGEPAHAQVLTAGSVELVNLSNNHIYDCGDAGFKETLEILRRSHVNYAGEGHIWRGTVKGVSFLVTGYRAWQDTPELRARISRDLNAARADVKLVQFHWGEEGKYHHNATQQRLAHYAVEHGATMVIGAHPHVLQDSEVYRGAPIFYSLGNFIFGANKNPRDKDTAIIRAVFNRRGLVSWKAIPARLSSQNSVNDFCPTTRISAAESASVLRKLAVKK